jgi:hypothetical protein
MDAGVYGESTWQAYDDLERNGNCIDFGEIITPPPQRIKRPYGLLREVGLGLILRALPKKNTDFLCYNGNEFKFIQRKLLRANNKKYNIFIYRVKSIICKGKTDAGRL